MLSVHSFTFNPFQENTYILSNEHNECWIIDPGMSDKNEETELVNFIQSQNLKPQAIINTHAHIDHILGIDFLVNKYHIPFYLHEKENPILMNAGNTARMFGFQFDGVNATPQSISENKTLKLGADELEVRFVPGHSPGSVAFYNKAGTWVISGDALFAGSIGRTDLPMGNYETLISSIKNNLLNLPGETKVYSGHGPSTTIQNEVQFNPFLQ